MAVRMIAKRGVNEVSIAAMAREMGISRANIYYHFENRDALLAAVKVWATEQMARGMDSGWPVPERTVSVNKLVLENPELIKIWIDDFLASDDIRQNYTMWDPFVEGMQRRFDEQRPEEEIDAEVYCTIMLTAAFIAPRIFAKSVRPDEPIDRILERFVKEQQRVLRRDGLEWEG